MIVDTGVIYADIDRSDDWHAAAAELLSTAPGPLRVPTLVVTEVCYLLQVRLDSAAEADFLMALSRQEFDLIPLTSGDYARAAELVRKYSDLPLGAVDASVIAVAERRRARGHWVGVVVREVRFGVRVVRSPCRGFLLGIAGLRCVTSIRLRSWKQGMTDSTTTHPLAVVLAELGWRGADVEAVSALSGLFLP